jgi:hypothetical protein
VLTSGAIRDYASSIGHGHTKHDDPPAYKNDFAVGDHISHPMFGNGIVTGIDQNKLTIEFSENVIKEIVVGYVKRQSG